MTIYLSGTTNILTKERKRATMYIHKEMRVGWFRFSFYKLFEKFTIRFEISRGWE